MNAIYMDELDKWIISEFIDELGFFYLFENDSGTIVQTPEARLTLTVDNDYECLEWTFESMRKGGDNGIFEDWALLFGYAPFPVPVLTWDWDHGIPLLTDESGETRPFDGKIGGKVRLLQTVEQTVEQTMETWDGLMEALYWDDVSEFVAYCKSVGMEVEVVGNGTNVSIKCGRSTLQFVSSYTEWIGEFRMDWKFTTERKFNDKLIIKEFYKFMDNAPFSINFCLDHDNSRIIVVPWDDVNEDWHDDAEPFVGSVGGWFWIIGG